MFLLQNIFRMQFQIRNLYVSIKNDIPDATSELRFVSFRYDSMSGCDFIAEAY